MLVASPIEATVTSMRSPLRAAAGNVAVTITAATFSMVRSVVATFRSKCSSMLAIACWVTTDFFESPVPLRPTTRP